MKENFFGGQPTPEQKDKINIKEVLNLAVRELQGIVANLPEKDENKTRAEHTLNSVKNALGRLGKEGAPIDKYRVPVEGYPGNPEPPYAQDEGVPVDELIEILRSQAKEINKNVRDKKTLDELKKKRDELYEKYRLAKDIELGPEDRNKHTLYSEWEQAKKAYEKAEKAADLGYFEEAKNLSDLADRLFNSSKSYFEAHYTKQHGEDETVWTGEERNKQDLRTRHEAKLISLDYRSTGNMEDDYKKAMDVLNRRRELDLLESEPPPPVIPPIVPPVIPPLPPQEKPKKVTAVEAKALAEFLARERGMKLLNEKLNQAGWLKRKWTQTWEQAYRVMFVEEERKKILGKENKPSWLRRKMFGASEIVATDKKNLFAGTGNEAESQKELANLVERFSADYIRNAEGEQKKQLEDPELKVKINDLIHEFATGAMTDVEFETRKDALMQEIAKKYPDILADDGLTADNFLEAARDFRKIYIHNQGLARTDVQLEIDLGVAKQAIKTKVNLNWVDKTMSWTQKHGGPVLSPEAVGIGVSIGSFFSRKPLYWLGGAAGLGGLMGAMRRNIEQKNDVEMHRVERAMGDEITDFGPDAKRRQGAERFVYEMKKASDIITNITALSTVFSASPDKANADALVAALAEAEARQSLSIMREKDLISFSGETALERGRLELLRTLAEAKVLLGKSAFSPGDIVLTKEYDKFMNSLGGDMDKIDNSERWHRWSENAKAGAIGAAGGLVAGGLVQQGFAFVGDRVSFLHWLRPGGKLTSGERLYHYLQGSLPTGPTGAGVDQILGIAGSTGTIRIDGSSHLTYDRSTGLWNMFDKSGHGGILAKFNVDPATGHTTPVPGSYDPNLISFSEVSTTTTVPGGPRTFTDWFNSVKGSFGKNVAEEKWHLGGVGFLENDTALPKTEFNELRLFSSYDASGHLKIDASKLQEYLADAASGKQIEGSSHAGKILEVAKAFSDGKIKLGLVPDASHPTEVLQLVLDPTTKTFTTENGSEITKFFTPDPKTGLPVLKGNGLLGMVHEVGTRPDGSQNIEWINAIRGNGEPIETGTVPRTETQFAAEITRKIPKEWWGLWAWNFRRKALEEKSGKQDEQGKGSKKDNDFGEIIPFGGKKKGKEGIFPGGIEYFEIPDIPDEKTKDRKIKKVVVDTRGQKIKGDRKDYQEDFPEKFPLKNEREMAIYLSSNKGILMHDEHIAEYKRLDEAEKVKFLEKLIKNERENLRIGSTKFDQETINGVIGVVLGQVDKVLDKYGEKENRSQLPAKEKIHVVGVLEYQAQAGIANKDGLGVCFVHNGEIFVNFDVLKQSVRDPKEFIPQLKRTIAHEVMHDAATNNYWMFQTEEDEKEIATSRRSGIKFVKRQGIELADGKRGKVKMGGQVLIERGRALNEAVTEALSEEITREIYASEGAEQPKFSIEPYSAERRIMEMLQEKFAVKFEDFAKAVVNRRAFRRLAEKLEGYERTLEGYERKDESEDRKVKHLRPKFTSLLMSVMDFEHNRGATLYRTTEQLIKGTKGIIISRQMKKGFPASLLDKNGNIQESLIDRYFLIDEEAEEKKKLPIAA